MMTVPGVRAPWVTCGGMRVAVGTLIAVVVGLGQH